MAPRSRGVRKHAKRPGGKNTPRAGTSREMNPCRFRETEKVFPGGERGVYSCTRLPQALTPVGQEQSSGGRRHRTMIVAMARVPEGGARRARGGRAASGERTRSRPRSQWPVGGAPGLRGAAGQWPRRSRAVEALRTTVEVLLRISAIKRRGAIGRRLQGVARQGRMRDQ